MSASDLILCKLLTDKRTRTPTLDPERSVAPPQDSGPNVPEDPTRRDEELSTSQVNNVVQQPWGLAINQIANPYLREIEDRARKAIMQRRENEPPSSASVSISTSIWCTELNLEINAQMVHDVRQNLKAKYHNCSVCYMIAGKEDSSHISGSGYKTIALDETANGWAEFKAKLKFPPGIICWNCLLPTVRIISLQF